MNVVDHWLASTRRARLADQGHDLVPQGIVIHYPTEGVIPVGHVFVQRDGSVTQLRPFNRQSPHCGPSTRNPAVDYDAGTIGVVLENAGPLVLSGGHYFAMTGKGGEYPRDVVQDAAHPNAEICAAARHEHWEDYGVPQFTALIHLLVALIAAYPTISFVAGHHELCPERAPDPGPALALDALRAAVFPAPDPAAWVEPAAVIEPTEAPHE